MNQCSAISHIVQITRRKLYIKGGRSMMIPSTTTTSPLLSFHLGSKQQQKHHQQYNFSSSSSSYNDTAKNLFCDSLEKTNKTTDGYEWSNLYDEALSMANAAYVSYPITWILREAQKGNLQNSQTFLQKLKLIQDRDLSTALYPQDFVDLVTNNLDYIQIHPDTPNAEDRYGWIRLFESYRELVDCEKGDRREDDISLLEFDDHGDFYRLAYGIGISRPRKRITLMFRGTYAEGTKDWKRNLQFNQLKVPLPLNLTSTQQAKYNQGRDTSLLFHRGCYEYLFRNSDRGIFYPKEKRYAEVLDNILDCVKLYPGYKLFISGHSLGGALALLVAFFASADDRIPKPVTCVSLGSLLIGDERFQRAFAHSEELGWIRHLRITNEHDPVPLLPPFSWYKPVGMHLKLFQEKGYNLSHASSKGEDVNENRLGRLIEALRSSSSVDSFLEQHYIVEYLRRLEREKENLECLDLNNCYRDPQYVGNIFRTRL